MGCKMQSMHKILLSTFLLFTPLCATAGWQVAQPPMGHHPTFFQTAGRPVAVPASSFTAAPAVFPKAYPSLGQPIPVYAISISGSLKENLERIMGRYHWRVVWKAPYDYNFDGRVTGSSLPNVVEKLLQPFPLQAVMYMSNRTMAVVPRSTVNNRT